MSLASLIASDAESTGQKPARIAGARPAGEHKEGHGSRRHRIRGLSPAAVIVIAAAALLGGIGLDRLLAGPGFGVPPPPLLRRLTFDQGIVRSARFADDGGVVVYSAAWNGGSLRLYTTQPSALRSTPLNLPDANLLSVSPTGGLAISLGPTFDSGIGAGTLGRALLSGSEARPVLRNVREADWMRDGETLAVVRHIDGRDQLEWPAGKVLYRTTGYLSSPRVSPDGTLLAFGDHPSYDPEAGSIQIIDPTGARTTLVSNLTRFRGLAWSKPGTEVWFSAATDDPQSFATLQAVSLAGSRRTVLSGAVDLALMDIDRSGRVLISGDTTLDHIESDSPSVRELASGFGSLVRAVSDTAERMALTQRGTGTTYLLTPTDGKSTRIGEGVAADISRDGRWTLTIAPVEPSRISIVSIATGELRELSNPSELKVVTARFFPDGEHIVIVGSRPGELLRGYIQDVNAGLITPFTKAGIEPLPAQSVVISGDGQRVALTDTDGRVRTFSIEGGSPQAIPGLGDGEYPVAWTADGTAILVTRGTQPPWQVDRLDLATGQRELWKVIAASQPVGLASSRLVLSPTGATYVHSYSQRFSSLFLVDGLR